MSKQPSNNLSGYQGLRQRQWQVSGGSATDVSPNHGTIMPRNIDAIGAIQRV